MSDFLRIFAHRGASRRAPENTIAAFSKAMEVGTAGSSSMWISSATAR